MSAKRQLERHEQFLSSLVDKKHLVLSVECENLEQATQLMEWMYSEEKPINLKLNEIAWDKVAVSKDEADFIDYARGIFGTY